MYGTLRPATDYLGKHSITLHSQGKNCNKCPDSKPAIDQLLEEPRVIKNKFEGICIGTVVFFTHLENKLQGQIWDKVPNQPRWWWVADGKKFYKISEWDMFIVSQSKL